MQALLVIMGIQSLVAAYDRRPAHTLHKRVFQNLSEPEFCNSTFVAQEFGWQEPTSFRADIKSDKAEIENLTYVNQGSIGRTPEGSHVYRLQMAAKIKDLRTNEVIQFPARFERLVEVDSRNRIVGCYPESNASRLKSDALQTMTSKACEKPGWTRRLMCDRGTERCYAMTLCERSS